MNIMRKRLLEDNWAATTNILEGLAIKHYVIKLNSLQYIDN